MCSFLSFIGNSIENKKKEEAICMKQPPPPKKVTSRNNRLYFCVKSLEGICFYSYPSLKNKTASKTNNKSQLGFLSQFSDKTSNLNTKTNLLGGVSWQT